MPSFQSIVVWIPHETDLKVARSRLKIEGKRANLIDCICNLINKDEFAATRYRCVSEHSVTHQKAWISGGNDRTNSSS